MWKLASAMFEAQTHGLLGFDVFAKRMVSRLLAQFRALERGGSDISERLAQDLLFFCAQSASPGDGRKTPRLAAVRQVYGLARHAPVDYAVSSLGRFDPAWIAQARKRVTAAKESWSAVAGGELHRMAGMSEQFSLVGDSLKRLFPLGETFGHELQMAVGQTQQSGSAPPTALAMEVATSLLYVEAALEDTDFDHPELGRACAGAWPSVSSNVRQGRAPDPLEPWMEELYRRVSDRQTMGSVVQELRASLSEAEKQIDQFFRNPRDRPRDADSGAEPARPRCAACCRCSAWTMPPRPCCACATKSTAWPRPKSTSTVSCRPACSTAWPATLAPSAS